MGLSWIRQKYEALFCRPGVYVKDNKKITGNRNNLAVAYA